LDPTFAVSVRGPWSILRVSGEVDMATAPRLRQQVVVMVNAGHVNVVLDLSAVDFLDSVGLGVVVGAVKRVRSNGGEIHIVCDSEQILRLFDITRLHAAVGIHATIEAALEVAEPAPIQGGAR
jgi:anti-sigma B factor antagonist